MFEYPRRSEQMLKIPVSLKEDTIVEALFEIRFHSKTKALANLLPGFLFKDIGAEFPVVEKLPITNIPPAIVQGDLSLLYAPQYKLSGKRYSILIGDHVFTVSCPKPYTGWKEFSTTIHRLTKLVRDTSLIDSVERFSIKYVNLIPQPDGKFSLDKLKIDLTVGAYNLKDKPVHLRSEIVVDEFINIVQMASNTVIELLSGESLGGVLFDIDTICQKQFSDFWNEMPGLLERAHKVEKEIFFGTLSDDALKELGPVWG